MSEAVSTSGDDVRWVTTLDGFECDTHLAVWNVPTPARSTRFDFTNLPGATPRLRADVVAMFRTRLHAESPEVLVRDLSRVRTLLRAAAGDGPAAPVERFDEAAFLSFEAGIPFRSRYLSGQMRDFLLAWRASGAGGLAPSLIELLDSIESTSHVVGEAVRTMCPVRGALTVDEEVRLTDALHGAYASGTIATDDYVMCIVSMGLNLRPMQLAMIKLVDTNSLPWMEVTRLKQGKGLRPRTTFKRHELDRALADLVALQIPAAENWAAANGIERDQGPLFPARSWPGKDGHPVEHLPDLRGHHFSGTIGRRITASITAMGLRTEAGTPLRAFPQRIRRSGGTRAADERHSAVVVADVLDQTALGSSRAYVQCTPAMVARIDGALGGALDAFAAAFLTGIGPTGETGVPA